MDISGFAIGGISLVFLIVGVVETAKRWGISGKGSEVLAFVVAFLFVGLAQAISMKLIPAVALPWIVLAVTALAGGLTATGYYDLLKRTGVLKSNDVC